MGEFRDNFASLRSRNRGRLPGGGPAAINLPPATTTIIFVLAVFYALDWLTGQLSGYRWLAEFMAFRGLGADPLSIMRLATYALVHADLGHLALNVVGVAVLGKVLEPVVGAGRLVAILVIGAAAGAVVHILLGETGYLIGVSAGVGALYGVALLPARAGYFGRLDQPVILLAMFFVITSMLGLLFGFMGNIAHAAHLGGFFAGLALSRQFIPRRSRRF